MKKREKIRPGKKNPDENMPVEWDVPTEYDDNVPDGDETEDEMPRRRLFFRLCVQQLDAD
ncbi:MAG TPA: hypothetical protein VJH92_03390 [Candidatus Nanoarchaeia archaeon]|nr:hypothetical protein [Candidatus Nanoarchaeia archaeon]